MAAAFAPCRRWTSYRAVTASALLILPAALLVDRIWLLPPPGTAVWVTFAQIALLSTALAYILYFAILARAVEHTKLNEIKKKKKIFPLCWIWNLR